MSATLSLRAARRDDVDALVAINAQVQRLHAAWEPILFPAVWDAGAVAAFFDDKLGRPEHRLAVAEADGEVAAYLWCEREERPATPFTVARTRLHIHHLAVCERWRRHGIASLLMGDAEAFGRSAGCDEAILNVWVANADAQEFYAHRGYGGARLTMSKTFA